MDDSTWQVRFRAGVLEPATADEAWYAQQGRHHSARVGGRDLQEQCLEAVKRDVTRHLARVPDLPADLRERLLTIFIQGRLLDARLLELCIRNGLYRLDLTNATRFCASSVDAVLNWYELWSGSVHDVHTLNLTSCLYLDTSAILRLVRGLSNLHTLILDGLEVQPQDLHELVNSITPQLRSLSLKDCTVSCRTRAQTVAYRPADHGGHVQRWRRFFVLDDDVDPFENLHLRLTRLTGVSLAGLSVQHANWGWSAEGEKGPYPLPVRTVNQLIDATANTLSYLDLSNVPLDGDALPNYAKASRLQALYLAGHNSEQLPSLLETTLTSIGTNLRALSLADCGPSLTDEFLCDLAPLVPALSELNLRGFAQLTSFTLRQFGNCCPGLRVLHIRHCPRVEPCAFFDDAKGTYAFSELQELDIVGCLRLTYRFEIMSNGNTIRTAIAWMTPPRLPSLQRLCVDWTQSEADDAISAFPRGFAPPRIYSDRWHQRPLQTDRGL